MTPDPKAPLPDEIVARLLWSIDGAIGHQLRAHIAAQAEKIAELEAEALSKGELVTSLDAACAKLEADNKRLREALEFYADHDWEDAERFNQNARPNPHDLALPARAALAPKQPEPCKTCGGTRTVPIFSKLANYMPQYIPSPCPTCNGTGRK